MIRTRQYRNRLIFVITVLYILMIAFIMLNRTDNFNYPILLKIRYAYLLCSAIYFLSTFKGILPRKPFLTLFLLSVHTFLFGVIYINPMVSDLTRVHFREMCIYILTIGLTSYFVWNQRLFSDFMQWNYWVIALVLIRSGITHLSHFVNPIYFIYVLNSHHSYRTTFGFGHANFTGNMCVFTLIYSVFVLEKIKGSLSFKGLMKIGYAKLIFFVDLIIGEMLFSTQSRTSILAGVAFVTVYVFFKWKDFFYSSYRTRAIVTFLTIFAIIMFLFIRGNSVWEGSHRENNVVVNYPIFKTFNPMTGMGYIPPYGFYENAYGLGTFALDIYYLYIFFTTGYLGSAIVLLFLLFTFIFSLQIKNPQKKYLSIAMFTAILITGIGQTNMVLYILLPSMINFTILCIHMSPELHI